MFDNLEKYPVLGHMQRYAQYLANKAETHENIAPSLSLWCLALIVEAALGILTMLTFAMLVIIAFLLMVLISIVSFAAWLLKLVGFPRFHTMITSSIIRRNARSAGYNL